MIVLLLNLPFKYVTIKSNWSSFTAEICNCQHIYNTVPETKILVPIVSTQSHLLLLLLLTTDQIDTLFRGYYLIYEVKYFLNLTLGTSCTQIIMYDHFSCAKHVFFEANNAKSGGSWGVAPDPVKNTCINLELKQRDSQNEQQKKSKHQIQSQSPSVN